MTTSQAVTTQLDPRALMEQVLVNGDLSKLSIPDRLNYYKAVCESIGVNPLTKPFDYITLNGKLTLYARKDCTDQLRRIYGVSVTEMTARVVEGIYLVVAHVKDATGRTDVATGAVSIENLKGESRANAMMKSESKAKRRATLSICGLGMLDETEAETIPGAVVPMTSSVKFKNMAADLVPHVMKIEEGGQTFYTVKDDDDGFTVGRDNGRIVCECGGDAPHPCEHIKAVKLWNDEQKAIPVAIPIVEEAEVVSEDAAAVEAEVRAFAKDRLGIDIPPSTTGGAGAAVALPEVEVRDKGTDEDMARFNTK